MSNNMFWGWAFFTLISASFAFMAAFLVVYMAPAAAQSGIVEMMAYLNGINH
jgi:H+/Cl- antiporter ClcA